MRGMKAAARRLKGHEPPCPQGVDACPGGTWLARCDAARASRPGRSNADVVRHFLVFSRVVGLLLIGVALSVLLGWSRGLVMLAAVVPGQVTMKPSAAIGFLIAGGALLLAHHGGRAARAGSTLCSVSLLLLGAAVLVQYLWGADLGIDHLFPDPDAGRLGRPPGRMAELAAVGFMLLGGIGLLMAVDRWLWLRDLLALGVIAIAMVGLASYGVTLAGQRGELFSHLPILTAVLLLLGALGWMSATPTVGLTRVATADSLGGVLARRLLLPSLLLPAAFSFAFKALQLRSGVSDAFALALAALFTGGTVACLIWWVAALLDRIERHRDEFKVLRDHATTDTLTGLINRRGFDAAISELLRRKKHFGMPFSLLLVDLDSFKNYNDRFGHLAGDEVLQRTGRILRDVMRPLDVAARYGGEEFAILLPEAGITAAAAVATRIAEKFHGDGWPNGPVTASIGVAEAMSGETASELVARADGALYEGKRTGRDRIVLAEAMRKSAA